ncbi:MAG: BatD family protein [Gammaproteobacteria bacterium]
MNLGNKRKYLSLCIHALTWIYFIVLAPLANAATDPPITAAVDRAEVRVGESFVLSYQASNFDAEPDFTPLDKDFEVLGTSRRTNIAIDNGHITKTTSWQLKLIPKHTGQIAIPAITFGSDHAPALTLNVAANGNGPGANADNTAMRLEVTATPESPYVQAQVLLTVRLFVPDSIDLVDSSFGDPKINGGDALITALGKARERSTLDNGVHVRIFERDYAIFPQKHGRMVIEPMMFEGQVFEGAATTDDPFGQSVRTYQLQSKPIVVDVKPVPTEFKGKHWLPAEKINLVENWSDDVATLKTGEPITRSVTLMAKGLTAGQLPEVDAANDPAFNTYPEQPTLDDQARSDGVTGLRMEKRALIAQTPGRHSLPEIRIPWWNTITDKPEVAILPARTFDVEGEVAAKPAPADVAQPERKKLVSPSPNQTASNTASPEVAARSERLWRWLALGLALGWACSMVLWWASRRQPTTAPQIAKAPNLRQLHAAVLAHARANDSAATRTSILNWAAAAGLINPSIEIIAQRFPALRSDLRALETHLYAATTQPWSGAALAKSFSTVSHDAAIAVNTVDTVSLLPPLYHSA